MKADYLPYCSLYLYWSYFAIILYLTISSLPCKFVNWHRIRDEMLCLFPENYLFSSS